MSPCRVSPPCSDRHGEPVWRVVLTDDPQLMMVQPNTLWWCLVAQLCLTLLRPHGDRQAPLSMGFSRQEYRSVLLFPSPGVLPNPGIKPLSPVLAGRFFTAEPPGKPLHFGLEENKGRKQSFWWISSSLVYLHLLILSLTFEGLSWQSSG